MTSLIRTASQIRGDRSAGLPAILTSQQLADAAGVTLDAVNKAARAGSIAVHRYLGRGPGNGYRFRTVDVRPYIERPRKGRP